MQLIHPLTFRLWSCCVYGWPWEHIFFYFMALFFLFCCKQVLSLLIFCCCRYIVTLLSFLVFCSLFVSFLSLLRYNRYQNKHLLLLQLLLQHITQYSLLSNDGISTFTYEIEGAMRCIIKGTASHLIL